MKKFLAAIILVIYTAATCGIVVNSHYCMKKLVSVHLFEGKGDHCAKCGMGMHKGVDCCKDEISVVKLVQDELTNPVASLEVKAPVPESTLFFATEDNFLKRFGVIKHFINHSPPLLSMQDIYLQNRVFRI